MRTFDETRVTLSGCSPCQAERVRLFQATYKSSTDQLYTVYVSANNPGCVKMFFNEHIPTLEIIERYRNGSIINPYILNIC